MYRCGYCGDYHQDEMPCPVEQQAEIDEMMEIVLAAEREENLKPASAYMRQWREKNRDRVRAYTRQQVKEWRARKASAYHPNNRAGDNPAGQTTCE